MKLVSLFLALCFSLNVFAETSKSIALEKALDEYQYTLTVEWDQKDQGLHDRAAKNLFDKVEVLISEGNLTQEEVLEVLASRIKDPKVLETIKLRTAISAPVHTADEFVRMVNESKDQLYSRGASWTGEEVVGTVGAALLLVGFIFIMVKAAARENDECVRYSDAYDDAGNSCDPSFDNNCNQSCTEWIKH